jgi:polar amino acid transport system substrate-binding protein
VRIPRATRPVDMTSFEFMMRKMSVGETVLRVGSNVPHPILLFEQEGYLVGLEWDLLAAVGTRLGLKPRLVRTAWIGALDDLVADKFDVLAFGVSITHERGREVLFAGPYLEFDQAVALRADDPIREFAGLAGKRVAAIRATTTLEAARRIPGARLVEYDPMVPTYRVLGESLPGLVVGKVDAVVHDRPVLEGFIRLQYPELAILGSIPTGEQYGLAFRPEQRALRDDTQAAIDEIASTGELAKMQERWRSWANLTGRDAVP